MVFEIRFGASDYINLGRRVTESIVHTYKTTRAYQ